MRFVTFDEETHLIRSGMLTPRMVCLSFAEAVEQDYLGEPERVLALHRALVPSADVIVELHEDVSKTTGTSRGHFVQGLMLRDRAVSWLRPMLEDPSVTIVGHNVCFDLGVAVAADPTLLRPVFEKFKAGLVHDTMTRQQLLDIATGQMKFHTDEDGEPKKTSYDLAALSLRLLDKRVQKKDTWRLKYALLDGVPLSQWEPEAKEYAIGDAVVTAQIHAKQDEVAGGPIPNSAEQHRAAWGLHLMSAWGIRTDGSAVKKLHEELAKDYAEMMEDLKPTGLLKVQPARTNRKGVFVPEKISKSMSVIYNRVVAAYEKKGEAYPQTEKGGVSTAKKTLVESGDPDLKKLSEAGATQKLLTTYVPVLESGTRWPINPRYNVLVETGRTSCSKPNIQNPPRKGGVRECFIPRPGWQFVFSDYDTLELRALSQVCLHMLGRSEMAEALRRGEDLHLSLAAEMNGMPYAEAKAQFDAGEKKIKDDRQFCKIPNFGFPGGLGADSFVDYAAGYDVVVTPEKAHEMKDLWFRRWPEMREYFERVASMTEAELPIRQVFSGRVRGGASFCAAANGFFQGLAADGAKEAVWRVAWECYVGTRLITVSDETSGTEKRAEPTNAPSPLHGCRPIFFIHDEIGLECPAKAFGPERSSAAAQRLSDVMIEAMRTYIPDIPVSCKPIMCARWYKGAEPVKVKGLLVPSKPVTTEKDGKKRTVWAADVPSYWHLEA